MSFGRDTAFVEDLGRSARGFSLDATSSARTTSTPATRCSPRSRLPARRAVSTRTTHAPRGVTGGVQVRESSGEGGMARISVSFTETESAPEFPASVESASSWSPRRRGCACAASLETRLRDAISLPTSVLETLGASSQRGRRSSSRCCPHCRSPCSTRLAAEARHRPRERSGGSSARAARPVRRNQGAVRRRRIPPNSASTHCSTPTRGRHVSAPVGFTR
jgi:hypothetical protein